MVQWSLSCHLYARLGKIPAQNSGKLLVNVDHSFQIWIYLQMFGIIPITSDYRQYSQDSNGTW